MRLVIGLLTALTLMLTTCLVAADDFAAESLIIPMDTSYQDDGMFRAYGLVYELLRNNVPVRWTIAVGKDHDEQDFVASALDYATATTISSHGYRGGPFVVESADRAAANSIIDSWLALYPETTVHIATEPFSADVGKYMVAAPKIAVFIDGNQDIVRTYLLAAAIPDSMLDYSWPETSPDMLDPAEVAGVSAVDHSDGALFDADGEPFYCAFVSAHWPIASAQANPEVVAEVREFLRHPTHFFAECQSVASFENETPFGLFLTPNGLVFESAPASVDYLSCDSPSAQLDGPFEPQGGPEPAFSLPQGDAYLAAGVTMITESGSPVGTRDVWVTGYLDGHCPTAAEVCDYGKVSYLGGHQYGTQTPMSTSPDSQGTRLFLNALFDSHCVTMDASLIFEDDFESGDTTEWSASFP